MLSKEEYLYKSNEKINYSSILKVLNNLSSQKKVKPEKDLYDQLSAIKSFSFYSKGDKTLSFLSNKTGRLDDTETNNKRDLNKKTWTIDEYRRYLVIFLMKKILGIRYSPELLNYLPTKNKRQIQSHYVRLKKSYNKFSEYFLIVFPEYTNKEIRIEYYKNEKNYQSNFNFLFNAIFHHLIDPKFVKYLISMKFDHDFVYAKIYKNFLYEPLHYLTKKNKLVNGSTDILDLKKFGIQENSLQMYLVSNKDLVDKKQSDITRECKAYPNKISLQIKNENLISKIERFQNREDIVITDDFLTQYTSHCFQLISSPTCSNISLAKP